LIFWLIDDRSCWYHTTKRKNKLKWFITMTYSHKFWYNSSSRTSTLPALSVFFPTMRSSHTRVSCNCREFAYFERRQITWMILLWMNTQQICRVQNSSWSCSDSCLEDAVIFSVDAAAGKDFCADIFAVITNLLQTNPYSLLHNYVWTNHCW
jgi:hypothetical protein